MHRIYLEYVLKGVYNALYVFLIRMSNINIYVISVQITLALFSYVLTDQN